LRDPVTLALEQVTSPAGVVVFENDARGNREMARDASGRVTRWTYNLFDQVTSVSVGETAAPLPPSTANVVTSTVAYNADGMPETVVDAVGTLDEASTSLVYDPVHRDDLVEVIDGRSQHWAYSYDPGTGDMVSVTDPLGNKTSMGYDPIGRLEWVVSPKGNLVGADPGLWKTRLVSDEFGRVIEETDPLGNRVKTGYDLNGNMVRVETGLSAAVTTGDVTTYGYDEVDRLEVVDPPGPGARSYEYDPDGRRTRFVNELNGQWVYGYDGLGRLESVTDPVGEVTSYGWNGEGRLGSVTQPGGNCAGAPKTGCITYAYDLAGRPTGVDYADPATPDITAITYDAVGRRTHASRGGDTEMWVWDQRSRLKSHTDVNGRSTGYGWDDMSNLTSISYPGQSTPVTREFDDAGRLESVMDWAGRLTTFSYDQNSNWSETVFPLSSQNRDVYSFDRADRMVGVAWNRGSTVLGGLSYGPRDLKGQVTTVTGTGVVAGQNQSWSYDDRDRLTATGTEGFGFDAATNLVDADGVLQVFDPAQRLCWTSQTVEGGDCGTPPADATTYGYDARGNRTSMTHPSGTTATFGFDAENRMTSAVLPTTWQDDTARQYVPVPAARIVDTTTGAGTCDGAPCARIAAGDPVAVKVTGVGGVPATGVTAVVVSIIASGTTGDGWLEVNPAGDAAAGTLPLNAGQTSAQTVTAKVAANGTIVLASDVGVDVSVDVVGYFRVPSPWVPALNYWPVTPTVTAESASGTGVCDGSPCGTLPAGETDIATAGRGGIPATGVNAVTVSILAQNASGGQVRVAPSGTAAAGELVWETGSVGAAGVFTVPLNPDGTITLETAGATSIRVAVTGYWKIPTGTDTGLGLDLLEAPTRLVDTTTGTGVCDGDPCDTLQSNTPVEVQATGQSGLSGEIMAVMVSVTATDPTGTGVLGVGTTEADLGGGIVVFDPAQHASTTMIIPLTGTGTFTIGSWTQTDVAIDAIGVFKAPTRTWRYEYDTTGMRTAKQLDNTAGTGIEWRKEHTWTAGSGLPLLLAEHQGAQSAYVIYGPGGTAIYQINTSGEVQYFHQDHQGSTRLTTNANGTTRNTISYNAHGEITANTNWWLEQPLAGYTGQYHDPETGHIYLRARHYDPTTGQFTSVDPLVTVTEEPYGYVGGNPANWQDPSGRFRIPGTSYCIDIADSACHGSARDEHGGTIQGIIYTPFDRPGLVATATATAFCLVPVVGWAECAVVSTVAFMARAGERIVDHGFSNSLGDNLVDGLLSYITVGLIGGSFDGLAHLKGLPAIRGSVEYAGRIIGAGYDGVSTVSWIAEQNQKRGDAGC
jgi:RHS repeat-associated protein